jgi:hypothetical protein
MTVVRMVALSLFVAGLFAVAPSPAAAFPSRVRAQAPEPSVFPTVRDPWRTWGVSPSPATPGHVRRHGGGAPVETPVIVVPPHAVWVAPAWFWNGFQWVFVPGHWVW